jgi:hypothetical protein
LFAMLGLALAPTLSHALDANQAANPWGQICTTPATDGSGSPALPGAGVNPAGHCPLCGPGTGPLGMLPGAAAALPVPAREVFVTGFRSVDAAHGFFFAAAQPRAPPPAF